MLPIRVEVKALGMTLVKDPVINGWVTFHIKDPFTPEIGDPIITNPIID